MLKGAGGGGDAGRWACWNTQVVVVEVVVEAVEEDAR
jgi:hypothetical protein